MFLSNKHIAKAYGSFISGKKVLIGSFKNNIKNFNLKKKERKKFYSYQVAEYIIYMIKKYFMIILWIKIR